MSLWHLDKDELDALNALHKTIKSSKKYSEKKVKRQVKNQPPGSIGTGRMEKINKAVRKLKTADKEARKTSLAAQDPYGRSVYIGELKGKARSLKGPKKEVKKQIKRIQKPTSIDFVTQHLGPNFVNQVRNQGMHRNTEEQAQPKAKKKT